MLTSPYVPPQLQRWDTWAAPERRRLCGRPGHASAKAPSLRLFAPPWRHTDEGSYQRSAKWTPGSSSSEPCDVAEGEGTLFAVATAGRLGVAADAKTDRFVDGTPKRGVFSTVG